MNNLTPLCPAVTHLLDQVRMHPDASIAMPTQFNFGFDVIDFAAMHADKTAFIAVSSDGESITPYSFSELSSRSNKAANFLRSIGTKRGDFAVVILPRVPAWYEIIVGCIKLGVVSMPGTNLLTARDIAFRVNKTNANTIIVSAEHVAKIQQIRHECPTLTHFVVVGDHVDGWTIYDVDVLNHSAELTAVDAGASRSDDMMMAYFTSGTTSHPKLVPRNHGYALAHALTGAFWLDQHRDDVHWTLSDTGWAKAAWGMLFAPWLLNSTMILYDGAEFDPSLHLQLIKKLSVTTFCAPPTIFRIFAQMNLADYDLSSIRHTVGAGEPLNPEVIRVWQQATGTIIHDGYGQTETVNIVANTKAFEVRPGSMGKAVPGFDIQIIDDDGSIVADDQMGHIAIRLTDPAPVGLFNGYYNHGGQLDRSSFRHGWYFTGDTATRDAQGYIWFVGRADDVISSAGYRISPFEVESALLEHPNVAESAVIGKPDDVRGHIVKAFVVLTEGSHGSDELTKDIQNFVKEVTAPYKYPREIEYLDSLPKTISGKIRRVELREQG